MSEAKTVQAHETVVGKTLINVGTAAASAAVFAMEKAGMSSKPVQAMAAALKIQLPDEKFRSPSLLPTAVVVNSGLLKKIHRDNNNAAIAAVVDHLLFDRHDFGMEQRSRSATGFVRPLVTDRTPVNQPLLFGLFSQANISGVPKRDYMSPHGIYGRRLFIDKRAPEWFKSAVNDPILLKDGMQFRVRVSGLLSNGTSAFAGPMARDLDHAILEWERECKLQAEFQNKLVQSYDSNDWLAQKAIMAHAAYLEYAKEKDGVLVAYDTKNFVGLMMKKAQNLCGHHLVMLVDGDAVATYSEGIKKKVTTMQYEAMTAIREFNLG